MKKLLCILIGHKDPVMIGAGVVDEEELFEMWKSWDRKCERCGKDLKPYPLINKKR